MACSWQKHITKLLKLKMDENIKVAANSKYS